MFGASFPCYGGFRTPADDCAGNDGWGVRRSQFQVSLRRIIVGGAASLHDAGETGPGRSRPHDECRADLAWHGRQRPSISGADFAGELFGPGQPLDARRYFIVLPDGVSHGQSSKPSDGLHAHFPRYDYDDRVAIHYRLLNDGLGVNHLRLIFETILSRKAATT